MTKDCKEDSNSARLHRLYYDATCTSLVIELNNARYQVMKAQPFTCHLDAHLDGKKEKHLNLKR